MTDADATAGSRKRKRGLTRRGRALLVSSVGLGCTARLLGLVELYVLAAGAAALVATAFAYVVTRRVDLDVQRTLDPAHLHAGGASRVRISVANFTARTTPLVALIDRLGPGGSPGPLKPATAKLLLPPLGPRQSDSADYRLPAEDRGVLRIGPLTGEVTDPFGLARRSMVLAATSELTVYPRLDRVRAPARQHGGQEDAESRHADVRSQSGGDFAGLREYQIGDDLRRVHWPSTARTGEIMIRQHEVARQGRVIVAVDVTGGSHSQESFEAALSAAASVLAASAAARCSVRLVSTDGFDSDYGTGTTHLHRAFGYLARLDGNGGELPADARKAAYAPTQTRTGTNRSRTANQAAVVLIATTASGAEPVARLAALAPSPEAVTLVIFDVAAPGRGQPVAAGAPFAGVGRTIAIARDHEFAPTWDRHQIGTRAATAVRT